MYILGLSAFLKNSAACLFEDGKLVAFAEEERFLRIKGAHNLFPTYSVKYCLTEARIKLSDIKKIAVGWDCRKYSFKMPAFFALSWLRYGIHNPSSGSPTVLNDLLRYNPRNYLHEVKLNLARAGTTNKIPTIEFVPHHLAHAASAYYASGFDEAGILVIDGSGEERTTSIFEGTGKEIREISHLNIPNSLGWFYAAMTAYLGFKAYEEEGHLMGLAPYGKKKDVIFEKMKKIIKIRNESYGVDPNYTRLGYHSYDKRFSDALVKLLGRPRFPGEPISQRHKDIAYATQSLLEEAALSLVKKTTGNGRVRKLCLSGGVSLNCKMNGVILASGLVDEIFVQPISSDAGSCLGAAMIVAKEAGFDPRHLMQDVYLGPSFSQEQVKKVLDEAQVSYTRPKSIEKKCAETIARGKIVAWFKGRMEGGPRALGARSILANPRKKGIKDYVNQKVKKRDAWRPFCPSIIEEKAHGYLSGLTKSQKEARFMIVTYPVPLRMQKEIQEVVHVDGTTRPQTVNARINKSYYNLIKEVGEKTGTPVVLNTSLNVKGEPIVCTPREALRCFASTGIDALAIEGFWIEKEK